MRQLKVTLYRNIDAFVRRCPIALSGATSHPSRPAKRTTQSQQGQRKSRRIVGAGGDDDTGAWAGARADTKHSAMQSSDDHAAIAETTASIEAVPLVSSSDDLQDIGFANDEPRDKRNPLHTLSYSDLDVRTRIFILKSLCDWQLETIDHPDSTYRRDNKLFGNGKFEADDLRAAPFALDRHGAEYWYFDDDCRVYMQSPVDPNTTLHRDHGNVDAKNMVTGFGTRQWKTIAMSISDLENLLSKLNSKKYKAETDLREQIAVILEDWKTTFASIEHKGVLCL